MRLMMVSNFYPPYVAGGAELVASRLSTWLAKKGVEVTVVSTCGPDGETDERIDDVRVLRYFPNNLWWNFERFSSTDIRSDTGKLAWNIRDLWNRSSAHRFARILDQIKPHILHSHNIKGFSPSIWAEAINRGIPFVHTIHDYQLLCWRGTMLRSNRTECRGQCSGCACATFVLRRLARRAQVICSPSKFVLQRHQSLGVVGLRRSLVVRNGVPIPPVRRSWRRTSTLRLLFLGQLRTEKGAHLLVQMMREAGQNVRLSIAGEGPLRPAMEALASADKRVNMHGFVLDERKETLFAESDALLFPSTWTENAPLVIAEAMIRGIPVIASHIGAIPEFVIDNYNGMLFEVGNVKALNKIVTRLSRESDLLDSLSMGASRSADGWTVAAMGRRYHEIYQTVLGNSKVGFRA